MRKKIVASLGGSQCLLTVPLAALGDSAAADNPFRVNEIPRDHSIVNFPDRLAQGMCGGRYKGRCGAWVDGMMMGGAMQRSVDPAHLPAPDSEGARLLNQYCTQCHESHRPLQHSAAGWTPVTARMNIRKQWMAQNSNLEIKAPTADDLQKITAYMQVQADPMARDSIYPTTGSLPALKKCRDSAKMRGKQYS